jgi:hypothetical protein
MPRPHQWLRRSPRASLCRQLRPRPPKSGCVDFLLCMRGLKCVFLWGNVCVCICLHVSMREIYCAQRLRHRSCQGVCMCVYIHIYIYIYIHISYAYIHILVCVFFHVFVCPCYVCMHAYVGICAWTRERERERERYTREQGCVQTTWGWARSSQGTCVGFYVHVNTYMCVYAYAHMKLQSNQNQSAYICNMCVHTFIYVYIHTRTHVYTFTGWGYPASGRNSDPRGHQGGDQGSARRKVSHKQTCPNES